MLSSGKALQYHQDKQQRWRKLHQSDTRAVWSCSVYQMLLKHRSVAFVRIHTIMLMSKNISLPGHDLSSTFFQIQCLTAMKKYHTRKSDFWHVNLALKQLNATNVSLKYCKTLMAKMSYSCMY